MRKLALSYGGNKLHVFDIDDEDGSARCLCNDKFYDEHQYEIYIKDDFFRHNSNYCKKCNKIEVD